MVGAAVLATAAALAFAMRGPPAVDIPAAGPWTITINQPRGDAASCFDDPAVSSSIMTADLPSSAASAQLMFAATRDDATRVVDCLRTTLTSGTVTVYTRH